MFIYKSDNYKIEHESSGAAPKILKLSDPLLSNVLDELWNYVNPIRSVKDFDDILHGWDGGLSWMAQQIVIQSPINRWVYNLQVKDANKMNARQSKCRIILKPVYGKVLMPVVRLANYGYSAYQSIDRSRASQIE